jgi:hypothetical protein
MQLLRQILADRPHGTAPRGRARDWRDEQVAPIVATELRVGLEAQRLVLNAPAPAAPFKVDVALAGALDSLHLEGQVSLDPEQLALQADLAIDGLRAGPLAAYLPPTTEVTLKEGRVRLHLDALFAARTEGDVKGGKRASFELTGLDYRDGQEGPSL